MDPFSYSGRFYLVDHFIVDVYFSPVWTFSVDLFSYVPTLLLSFTKTFLVVAETGLPVPK